MTSTRASLETDQPTAPGAPPYSRLVQTAAGSCLVLAGLLNGLPQYVTSLITGDLSFSEQIAWSADGHGALHRTEQTLLVLSTLFLPLGLLGIAQVTRWHARRLTLVAVPLVLWGMWGFHNVLAMGYVAGTVTPGALSVDDAVTLNDSLIDDPGVVVTALLPHLLGSFFGVLLLMVAAWRSGLPRVPAALTIAFLLWDFLLPAVGPLEPHLLLAVAWTWLGIAVVRLPSERWRGAASR